VSNVDTELDEVEVKEDKKKTNRKTTTKKATTRKKTIKKDVDGDDDKPKLTVKDIVFDRILQRIELEKRLPWQKPFQSSCMNWATKREYSGINRVLLSGGEYLTKKQIIDYNEKNGTSFWFEKGSTEIVVFYRKREIRVSNEVAKDMIAKGRASELTPKDDGWYKKSFVLVYHKVYNIAFIKDKEGNTLTPHIGNGVFEIYTPADEIISRYTKNSKVGITHIEGIGAFYRDRNDCVYSPPPTHYLSAEAYYRVIFHELIHSTGISKRLNRKCFEDYDEGRRERSKEELVAEVGGLLLASEAGFRDDSEWAENSITYIAGWVEWMRNNKTELVNGIFAAEKAKTYILNGGSLTPPVVTDNLETEQEDELELEDV
jgi:antirestriction protein ArdC